MLLSRCFVCVVCFQPKCGFLPSSRHVSKDIKTKVCRFCMHQHYKVTTTPAQCEHSMKVQSRIITRVLKNCSKTTWGHNYNTIQHKTTEQKTFLFVVCITLLLLSSFDIVSFIRTILSLSRQVANGKWKRRSLYCPLDLFSGWDHCSHCCYRFPLNIKTKRGKWNLKNVKVESNPSCDI